MPKQTRQSTAYREFILLNLLMKISPFLSVTSRMVRVLRKGQDVQSGLER
ncbi:MAG: hypothetical protein CM1200mP28_18170 [Deltaproteobacteria bacterium]|nr:MAG: hypothetical protein CM1200mP28_18170 [Deltaproteobacteria bacterium]